MIKLALCFTGTFLVLFMARAELTVGKASRATSRVTAVPSSFSSNLTKLCKARISIEVKAHLSEALAESVAEKSCRSIVNTAAAACSNSKAGGLKKVGGYGTDYNDCSSICTGGLDYRKPEYPELFRICNTLCMNEKRGI